MYNEDLARQREALINEVHQLESRYQVIMKEKDSYFKRRETKLKIRELMSKTEKVEKQINELK